MLINSGDILAFLLKVNNTFQAVIATDSLKTVAVFIYDDIQWGQKSQFGFYAGDEYNSYLLPESHTSQILNMSELTNVREPGVFIFRIDSKLLELASCD